MKYFVYPYKQGSKSAKALADALGGKVIKLTNSKYVPKKGHIIVNWGSSNCPFDTDVPGVTFVNSPHWIHVASNKLATFEVLKEEEVSIPEFTTSMEFVQKQVSEKEPWCVRKRLTGHSGQGLSVVRKPEDVTQAPLYVKYIKKSLEVRVHIFKDKLIDYQEKKKTTGWKENPNYSSEIRHLQTGWVYCREGVTPDQRAVDESIKAIKALGLTFGAVDLIYNKYMDKFFVLEVNTAPGLVGTTLQNYVTAFKGI